jgi:hypothetical protein
VWDISPVKTVKADDRRRVQIPGIKAGQVFALEDEGGKVILTPLKKAEPKTIMLKLVKRGGRLVPDTTGLTIDPRDIGEAVKEDWDALAERAVRP